MIKCRKSAHESGFQIADKVFYIGTLFSKKSSYRALFPKKLAFLWTKIIVFESFWGNFFKKRPKQGLGQGLDFYFWFPKITEKRVVIKRLLPLSNPLWPEPRVSGVVCTLLTAPLCKGSCQRSWLRDWFCIFTEIDYCIGLVLTILHSMQKIRSRSRLMGCFVVS